MKFNYCPNCGTKDSVVAENTTHSQCNTCSWDFWNNPKAAMSVIFRNDKGELLFAKRARDPEKGKYDFPGGFVDFGEDLFEATVREIREETGATIATEDLELLTVYTVDYIPGVSALDVILVVKKWQGSFKAADDVADLEWKAPSFIRDACFRPDYPALEEKIAAYLSA